MGRVISNNVGLIVTTESAPGVAGTQWDDLEPNNISRYGAETTKEARTPISRLRRRRKGALTDVRSAVEVEHDLTMHVLDLFAESFLFASAVNAELDFRPTAAETSGDSYTVAALSAAQAGKLDFSAGEFASLIYARGFVQDANNGLKQLDTDVATSDTALPVTANLVDETPPAGASVQLAGLRFLDGTTDLTYAYAAGVATVTCALGGFAWSDFGLSVGQAVHVGSADADGDVQNALQDAGANDQFGFGRVRSLSGGVMTLDRLDARLQNNAPTVPATVDFLFGKFVRDVATDHASFLERTHQFEASFPNLMPGPATGYEYAVGNFADALSIALSSASKATCTLGFVGTDTEPVTDTRKTGASSSREPAKTAALNCSTDVVRLRVMDADAEGATTDFKDVTLTIGNNVTPETVIGTLGAKYMNYGTFAVDIEGTALFTDAVVPNAIRSNDTMAMDLVLVGDDGGVYIDAPALTLGGGAKSFPLNESVKIALTGEIFGDDELDLALSMSLFPVLPHPSNYD